MKNYLKVILFVVLIVCCFNFVACSNYESEICDVKTLKTHLIETNELTEGESLSLLKVYSNKNYNGKSATIVKFEILLDENESEDGSIILGGNISDWALIVGNDIQFLRDYNHAVNKNDKTTMQNNKDVNFAVQLILNGDKTWKEINTKKIQDKI